MPSVPPSHCSYTPPSPVSGLRVSDGGHLEGRRGTGGAAKPPGAERGCIQAQETQLAKNT